MYTSYKISSRFGGDDKKQTKNTENRELMARTLILRLQTVILKLIILIHCFYIVILKLIILINCFYIVILKLIILINCLNIVI
jgi:hypothetical protein